MKVGNLNFTERNTFMRPLGILLSGAFFVCLAGMRDFAWTMPLYRDPWKSFSGFMDQSLFEGEWLGGSDFGVLLPICAFFIWLFKFYRRSPITSQNTLENLKFVFLSGLFAPLVAVQSMKWLVSRARPKVYLTEVLPTLSAESMSQFLPGFMGLTGPRGYSWNSFPSGHTSTAAVFLVFVYLYGYCPLSRFVLFLPVIGFCALMAISRSMEGMHWISDSVASFFVVWAVIDYLNQNRKRKLAVN